MTLTSLIQLITTIIAAAIPIAAGVALIAFFWGIFMAFGKVDSVDSRAEARQTIMWSMIALFVLFTLGGIIMVISNTFSLGVAGGGGGGGAFTPSGSSVQPGGSSQTVPLPRTGGDPLNIIPGSGRNFGPSDIAP